VFAWFRFTVVHRATLSAPFRVNDEVVSFAPVATHGVGHASCATAESKRRASRWVKATQDIS
jgi:hypothetical protein